MGTEIAQWAGMILVVLQLWAVSGQHYRAGWVLCLVACVAWGYVAVATSLPALLIQQFIITVLSIRGLMKLRSKP